MKWTEGEKRGLISITASPQVDLILCSGIAHYDTRTRYLIWKSAPMIVAPLPFWIIMKRLFDGTGMVRNLAPKSIQLGSCEGHKGWFSWTSLFSCCLLTIKYQQSTTKLRAGLFSVTHVLVFERSCFDSTGVCVQGLVKEIPCN